MNLIPLCVFLLATPISTMADNDAAVQQELKLLAGVWKAVVLEANGTQLPKEAVPEFTFTIGSDGKSTGKMANGSYQSKITVHPGKSPKTMDNTHETGDHKGKKQFGVYKLEGDKLTVCITAPGRTENDRPKDFSTKGSANVVFVFERVKQVK